jgi:hypothetical protein
MTNESSTRSPQPGQGRRDDNRTASSPDREQVKIENRERYRSAVDASYRISDREIERALSRCLPAG